MLFCLQITSRSVRSASLLTISHRCASRKSDVLSRDSDLCYTFLKTPTPEDVANDRAREEKVRAQLQQIIDKREVMSKRALRERKETVDALEMMKDKYVILLRQRTMIQRSIKRRAEEMKKLKKVIQTHQKALAA